ncbi:MAG TPA: hypothetical protein VNU44_06835, partial [Bryobacteraceae bacterium]|nr:hypothetical protein [Bryobacteraceae bacterium]
LPQPFSWPPALLHTLGLLQEGYIRNPSQLPDAVKSDASRILATAYSKGALWDRRWVLEAAGVVEPAVLLWLLRKAFESNSQWVRDAAYRQAARLAEVPHDIVRAICLKTAAIAASRPSYRERVATYTHLARLDPKLGLTEAAKLLFSISAVDVALTFALIALFLSRLPRTTYLVMFCLAAAAMPPLTTVAFALGLRRQYQTVGARSKPIFLVPMHLMIDRAIRFEPAMFFALNLRALLFAGVLGLHGVITPKGILGWYFLYVMFWAPLAIAAGSRAFMTQRLAWPFIPLSPGIYCFRYPQRVLGSLRVLWKSRNDLIYLGGAMAAFLAVEGILLKLGERFLKKLMPWIMGLGATTMIIFWLTQLVSNWGRLRRYLSLNAEPPIVSDFFNNIQSFTLAYFRSRYVRHSRVRGLIISSELNVRTLEAFALALEAQVQLVGDRERIRKAIEQISARVGAEQFRRWYESEPKRSWLKGADPQTLDEINLLIQSLRDNSPLTPAAETRRVLSSP